MKRATKQELRKQMRAQLAALTPAEVRARSAAIWERLSVLPAFAGAQHLLLYVSKDSEENPIAMALKMQKLGTLFDASCELKIPVASLTGTYTREEISSYAARGRARFSKASLTFFDLDIAFPEPHAARVSLTARFEGRTNFGEVTRETRELLCLLRKIDRQWLFNSIEAIEVLKK